MSTRAAWRRGLSGLVFLFRLLGWTACAIALTVGAAAAVATYAIPLKLIAGALAGFWLVVVCLALYALRIEQGHSWSYVGGLARRLLTGRFPDDRTAIAEAVRDQLRDEPPAAREVAIAAMLELADERCEGGRRPEAP